MRDAGTAFFSAECVAQTELCKSGNAGKSQDRAQRGIVHDLALLCGVEDFYENLSQENLWG
jgi:hypothetical protein